MEDLGNGRGGSVCASNAGALPIALRSFFRKFNSDLMKGRGGGGGGDWGDLHSSLPLSVVLYDVVAQSADISVTEP